MSATTNAHRPVAANRIDREPESDSWASSIVLGIFVAVVVCALIFGASFAFAGGAL